MLSQQERVEQLSALRRAASREKEAKSWLAGSVCAFLVACLLPLASLFPAVISAKAEWFVETVLLLISLWLLYFVAFGEFRGNSYSNGNDSTSNRPTQPLAPVPIYSSSSQTSTVGGAAPSTPSFGGGVPKYASSSNSSSNSSSARKRFMGTSPQLDDGNFRTRAPGYTWDEIETTRRTVQQHSSPVGRSVAPAAQGWQSSGDSSAQYQTSPKDRVSGYKKLDDGRAIEYQPASRWLGLDQFSSIWAETLRKVLGDHVRRKLRDFDDVAKRIRDPLVDHYNLSKKGGSAAPAAGALNLFMPAPAPAATPAGSGASELNRKNLDLMKRVLDVLLLRAESVSVESSASATTVDLFDLLDPLDSLSLPAAAPAPAMGGFLQPLVQASSATNSSSSSKDELKAMHKTYKEKLQLFVLLGQGDPYRNKSRGLVGICDEMRTVCGSHDGYLILAGGRRGGGGRSVAAAAAAAGRRSAATANDDQLIISIFFNYCDLHQEDYSVSSKHSFSSQYYFSSYQSLLNNANSSASVGIVRNDHGEFDVFVIENGRVLLLEIGREDGYFAYNVILVFLFAFVRKLGQATGPDDVGAVSLVNLVMGCDATPRGSTECIQRLREKFGWAIVG